MSNQLVTHPARRQRPPTSARTNTRPRHRPRAFARAEARAALIFLTPLTIGLMVFVAGPIIASLYFTFTKWDLIAPAPTWVGFDNWTYLFTDEHLLQAFGNTLRFILYGTVSFLIAGLVVALLTVKPRRFVGLYRAAFFLPYVLSQVAVGLVWKWIFSTDSGPLTAIAQGVFGLNPQWLQDSKLAMPSIALMTTWQALGYAVTLYIAGINGVPETLLEAARIDGTNAFQRFRYVTLPSMAPTVLFLTITSLIGAFQLYDPVVAMTSSLGSPADAGGPNGSTRSVVLYLYQQMFYAVGGQSGLGYAAAIGWSLALVMLIITAIQFTLFARFNGTSER